MTTPAAPARKNNPLRGLALGLILIVVLFSPVGHALLTTIGVVIFFLLGCLFAGFVLSMAGVRRN